MKISNTLKSVVYEVAIRIIEKFRDQELQKDEEEIVLEATMIKVGIEKIPKIIEQQKNNTKNKGIELTEDFVLFMICKKNHLFNRIYNQYETIDYKNKSIESIIEDWKESRVNIEGIEKFMNTRDEHFNNNAYYWYLQLKDNDLFIDLEVPFKILSEYLFFLENYRTPISCVDRLKKTMGDYDLTKEQKLFIFDKLNGLIANADVEVQEKLAHINIEVMDARLSIEPYDDLNPEKYSIEYIVSEAEKFDDLYERLKFLRHRKLEYEKEVEDVGWGIGLDKEIQVEIDVLEKIITEKGNTIQGNQDISTTELFNHVQNFIKNGQTMKAIDYLINLYNVENKSERMDFVQLSGQWKEVERKVNLGIMDNTEAEKTKNRITNAVSSFMRETKI
jgi:hypothetical protein